MVGSKVDDVGVVGSDIVMAWVAIDVLFAEYTELSKRASTVPASVVINCAGVLIRIFEQTRKEHLNMTWWGRNADSSSGGHITSDFTL